MGKKDFAARPNRWNLQRSDLYGQERKEKSARSRSVANRSRQPSSNQKNS